MMDRPRPGLKQTMAGMILAAAMQGVKLALPNDSPRVPPSPEMRDKTKRQRWTAYQKSRRRAENRANAKANRESRAWRRKVPDDAQELKNSMTNWQASQYARAGRPKGLEDIRRFATMPRRRD